MGVWYFIFEDGECRPRDRVKGRSGITRERVAKVQREGGDLSEAELLRCRARYFVDGLVSGSASFVNQVFAWSRGYFGKTRRSGTRRMRGVETTLCTMRDLQKDAVVP